MRQVPHQRALSIQDFQRKKKLNQPIIMLTCYDYPSAKIAANTALDCLLVGDSVAMTVHGYPNTLHATIDMMMMHTQAVKKGLGSQFLVTDLPFLSYRHSLSETIRHIQQLIQAGAQAVKLEGGDKTVCDTITYVTTAGIPVIGHIGLTPQYMHQLGGYHVQGRSDTAQQQLLAQAKALESAGCFALILECIPALLAQTITQALSIPTIGIGAGPHTDGQVLVWHDVLGLNLTFKPKFIKHYAQLSKTMQHAIKKYCQEVHSHLFPAMEETYE